MGDPYNLGYIFNDIEEENGVLKMTGPAKSLLWMNLDTDEADNHFPIGSMLATKIRYVGESATNVDFQLCSDYFESCSSYQDLNNGEWVSVNFLSSSAFSKLGFLAFWDGTWNNDTDRIEIDWAEIGQGEWSDWNDPCENQYGCPIENAPDEGFVQYKFNLSTEDEFITPEVNSVTFASGYQAAGIFTSNEINFTELTDLYSIELDKEEPVGTSISLDYSIDSGLTWTTLGTENSYDFPHLTRTNSFMWRTNFSTSNSENTPVLHGLVLNTSPADLIPPPNNTEKIIFSLKNGDENVDIESTNYTNDRSPELSGTNTEAAGGIIKIYFINKKGGKKLVRTISVDSDGDWEGLLPKKKDGTYQYFIKTIDHSENVSSRSRIIKFVIDTQKPQMKFLPKFLSLRRGSRVDFEATDERSGVDYYKVKLQGARNSWRQQKESFYVIPKNVPPGSYQFFVRAYDKAGNYAQQEAKIIVR